MNSSPKILEDLLEEVSKLELRVKELGLENRDLCDICNESGIPYKERLAARRHKRYFARLCAEHPIETTATALDLVGAAPIVRGIAESAGSVFCMCLITRCFFATFRQLTVQFPWRFGSRIVSTLVRKGGPALMTQRIHT